MSSTLEKPPSKVKMFAGVWLRKRLYEPKHALVSTDEDTLVMWLQSSCGLFVDIRLPAAAGVKDRKTTQVKSFAGTSTYDESAGVFTWIRAIDYRLPGTPDQGYMYMRQPAEFEADGQGKGQATGAQAGRVRTLDPPVHVWCDAVLACPTAAQPELDVLIEESVAEGDDYREVWQRIERAGGAEGSRDRGWQLQHTSEAGRVGFFVVVGQYWALALGRSHALMQHHGVSEESIREFFTNQGSGSGTVTAAVETCLGSYTCCVGRLCSSSETPASPDMDMGIPDRESAEQWSGHGYRLGRILHITAGDWEGGMIPAHVLSDWIVCPQ